MDGTTAYVLIQRHADNWADIGMMMDEWLAANRCPPIPSTPAEAKEFIGSNFVSCAIGQQPGGPPDEDDSYVLTAHDLLSAFSEWAER